MPQFAPSEAKTAVAPIMVQPSGLSCEAEIFLGPDEMTKVATSGRIPFTSTGVSQNVRLPIVMPTTEGTYGVFIDVYADGMLIAAYQAIEDVIIGEAIAFTGFSLLLVNCPPGTAYWLADFPFRGYPEKITMRPIGEAGWITADAPGTDTIRIILIDANYQCIDPNCERHYTLFFRDGYHYLLDLTTGELGINPNPPPFLPEETPKPAVISVNIPAVVSGEAFQVDATIFLPILRGDNQGWRFNLGLNGGRIRLYEALYAQFLSPALIAVSGEVGQLFIPLNSPDDIYTVQMKSSARYWPTQWTVEPLPPGSYPVTATASSIYYFWVPGPAGGLASTDVENFDLGIVGTLVVT